MRIFLRLLIHLDYSFLEEVATHVADGDENAQQSDEEIVLAALDGTADEKLTGLALRLVLSDHLGIASLDTLDQAFPESCGDRKGDGAFRDASVGESLVECNPCRP